MTAASPARYEIYGLRINDSSEYRYVGLTTVGALNRFKSHAKSSRVSGPKYPVHCWISKHGIDNISVDILEVCSSLEELKNAERVWISRFRKAGLNLLNITDGGESASGHRWTPEQRQAQSERLLGREGWSKGLSGPGTPMFGKKHSAETKAKWSEIRKGSITGDKNPNFGKFGSEHPSYGRAVSSEERRKASEAKLGSKNPQYGKPAPNRGTPQSAEAKEKQRNTLHIKWHVNRNIKKNGCTLCGI